MVQKCSETEPNQTRSGWLNGCGSAQPWPDHVRSAHPIGPSTVVRRSEIPARRHGQRRQGSGMVELTTANMLTVMVTQKGWGWNLAGDGGELEWVPTIGDKKALENGRCQQIRRRWRRCGGRRRQLWRQLAEIGPESRRVPAKTIAVGCQSAPGMIPDWRVYNVGHNGGECVGDRVFGPPELAPQGDGRKTVSESPTAFPAKQQSGSVVFDSVVHGKVYRGNC